MSTARPSRPSRGIALPAPLAAVRTQLLTTWSGLAPRERMGAGAAMLFVGLLIVWMIAVAPALRVLRSAPATLDALDAQLQSMQRLAGEVRELRSVAPVSTSQAADALKSATDRLGDKARISIQGDRATLTLAGISGERLRGWLGEVRSGARARPIEAQLTRGPQGYGGTLIVSFGGGA